MIRRLILLLATAITLVALVSLTLRAPAPAIAGGATQISGVGFWDTAGECNDPQGQGYDFATKMTGDLEGCLYTIVETAECTPSGTYHESGIELFVDSDGSSTFETTYIFQAKYQDCPNLVEEIVGRCQHPIVDGSGTGVYAGVDGRLHFKDDVEAGNFPFTGHLQWEGSP